MKHIITTFILLLLLNKTLHAQERVNMHPDSVRIELPDQKSIVVFELREIKKDPAVITRFPAYLKELLTYVEKSSSEDLATAAPLHVDVRIIPEDEDFTWSMGTEITGKPSRERMEISFSKVEPVKTRLTVREKEIVELLPPGWELQITSKESKISIYSESYQSLQKISDLNFSEITSKVTTDGDFKTIARKSLKSKIIFKDNKIMDSDSDVVHPLDMLFITFIGGVGVVRDQIYPQLSGKVGIMLNDHFKRPNIRPSIIYDNLFFAQKVTDGYQMNMNGFLSLSFEKNFNKKSKTPNWTGIGVGLLTNKSGDYFTGNTMKFFISHEMENRRISIVPEFYLTDDYKKFTFGTTLRYTF